MQDANLYINLENHSKFLIADRGYGDSSLYDYLKSFFNITMIAPLKGNKSRKSLINKTQYCDADLRMHSW